MWFQDLLNCKFDLTVRDLCDFRDESLLSFISAFLYSPSPATEEEKERILSKLAEIRSAIDCRKRKEALKEAVSLQCPQSNHLAFDSCFDSIPCFQEYIKYGVIGKNDNLAQMKNLSLLDSMDFTLDHEPDSLVPDLMEGVVEDFPEPDPDSMIFESPPTKQVDAFQDLVEKGIDLLTRLLNARKLILDSVMQSRPNLDSFQVSIFCNDIYKQAFPIIDKGLDRDLNTFVAMKLDALHYGRETCSH